MTADILFFAFVLLSGPDHLPSPGLVNYTRFFLMGLEAGKSEVKMLVDWVSGEDPGFLVRR